jgi:hypothetical protein
LCPDEFYKITRYPGYYIKGKDAYKKVKIHRYIGL